MVPFCFSHHLIQHYSLLFLLLLFLTIQTNPICSAPAEFASSTPVVEEENDGQQPTIKEKLGDVANKSMNWLREKFTTYISIPVWRRNEDTTDDGDSQNQTMVVDLLNQTKHVGDIVQLWDDSELTGAMRNALKSTSNNRWTTQRDSDGKYVIPYVITGTYSNQERRVIQRAMDAIDNNTCIRFRQRRSEMDYVDIQNQKDEGCYTTVGRIRGRQVVMLETGWTRSCGWGCRQTFPGCLEFSTVIHELFHKMGLWHEQMRYDRDDYIKIHWENIPNGLHTQFRKVGRAESTTYNVPYDYRSVMHYGKSSGARSSGLVTMETVNKRYQDVIGNAKDASPDDYRKICSIYRCSRCMQRAFTPLRST